MSTWTSSVVAARARARASSSVDSFEKAKITRSTSSSRTSSASCSGAPRSARWSRSSLPRLRLGVDEADEVDAVLGVLEQLARHELADVAGADDDRVLEVGDAAPAPEARATERADGDEHDRERPEARSTSTRSGAASPDQPRADEEEPDADRDQVEDAAEVVRRSGGASAPRPGRRGRRASRSGSSPEAWPGAPRTRAPPRSDGARPSRRRNRARRERRSRRARPRLRGRACGASASLGGAPCPTRGAARGSRVSAGSRTRSSVRRRSTAARTRSPSSFRPCCPHYLPLLSVPPPDLRHLLSLGLWNRVFKARVESPTGDEVAGRSEGDRVALPRNQGANRPSQLGRRRDGGFASATKNPLSPQFLEKELAPESGSPVPGMAESPTPPI